MARIRKACVVVLMIISVMVLAVHGNEEDVYKQEQRGMVDFLFKNIALYYLGITSRNLGYANSQTIYWNATF